MDLDESRSTSAFDRGFSLPELHDIVIEPDGRYRLVRVGGGSDDVSAAAPNTTTTVAPAPRVEDVDCSITAQRRSRTLTVTNNGDLPVRAWRLLVDRGRAGSLTFDDLDVDVTDSDDPDAMDPILVSYVDSDQTGTSEWTSSVTLPRSAMRLIGGFPCTVVAVS